MITVGPSIGDGVRRLPTVASAPSPRGTTDCIQVHLNKIKQGSYESMPATLVRFEVTISSLVRAKEICLDLQVMSESGWKTKEGGTHHNPRIIAYGPASVSGSIEQPGTADPQHLATVRMRETKQGVLLQSISSPSGWHDSPDVFHFAVIVVHSERIPIRVIPSMDSKRRMIAGKRTQVYPVILDLSTEYGEELGTCGCNGDEGCHSTCNDLGVEHMTVAKWTTVLRGFDLCKFTAESSTNVSPQVCRHFTDH